MKQESKKKHGYESKMTIRTNGNGKRAEKWSAEVEMMERDNDSMIRDDETMIVLNYIDLANTNAMELKRF